MRQIGLIILLFFTSLAYAQNVEFKASAPSVVAVGEQFKLEYTLNKEGDNLKVPTLEGFDLLMGPSVGQSFYSSNINGKMTQNVTFSQVGNVSVPEARTIMIQPWEPNLLKEIEKAILVSDIGITPTNDGKAIRLNFPDLTEERRKELAKDVKKRGEEAKVAVRNIRRDANDFVKKQNKAGDLNEDQAKDEEDKVQKMTDKYIKQIDEAVDAKSKEIMTV